MAHGRAVGSVGLLSSSNSSSYTEKFNSEWWINNLDWEWWINSLSHELPGWHTSCLALPALAVPAVCAARSRGRRGFMGMCNYRCCLWIDLSEYILCECAVKPLPRCMMMADSSTWSRSWWREGSCWTGFWGRNSSRSGRPALCSSPSPRPWTTCTAREWVSPSTPHPCHSSEITSPFPWGLCLACFYATRLYILSRKWIIETTYPVILAKPFDSTLYETADFCPVLLVAKWGCWLQLHYEPGGFYYITWTGMFGSFKVM